MIRNRRSLSQSISFSDKLDKISDQAALLYTWNIPHLDDYGRGDAGVSYLKKKVVPGRDWTKLQIEGFKNEIHKSGLMHCYTHKGKEYWAMSEDDWNYHQRGAWQGIHRKESNIPPPNTENGKK